MNIRIGLLTYLSHVELSAIASASQRDLEMLASICDEIRAEYSTFESEDSFRATLTNIITDSEEGERFYKNKNEPAIALEYAFKYTRATNILEGLTAFLNPPDDIHAGEHP